TLSEELARIVTRVFPFFRSGPDQIHEIKGIIQTSLLKAVLRKNSGQEEKREEDEVDDEKLLMRTMDAVLPPDILTQLATTLTLTPQDENTVLLSAKVHHPILNKDFPLVLRMVRTPDGWIVRNLANAEELARQFRQHLLHRLEARHTILVSKRGTVLERMGSTMSGLSCTASAGLLSDG
ncbi:MAG: translation initiation factor IF-2, partial [Desulfovibrionaceae bacterium]|nr:translation initiation factor IF-2 [Desulfovibrionaceae bacterium]